MNYEAYIIIIGMIIGLFGTTILMAKALMNKPKYNPEIHKYLK